MSELDKYFEKAKNVEPIYEEDDAKKLLYGKLSDGGIATNLYNKIKAFPMITTLITSVATIATIAILSLSNPNNKVEQPNKGSSPALVEQTKEEPNEKPKDLNWTEDKLPTADNSIALLSEKEQETTKKPRDLNWTEEKIDIKSVNSLKLTKDELAKLGIEINGKNFKVNAFDKYTYTINQNNEKQRDYYDKDEDRDALPTPAMVTTSTGFKTLTLFKKGNVEATVDRYRSESEDGKLAEQTISVSEFEFENKFENAPKFNMNEQSFEEYQQSLSGHKDSAAIIQEMESIKELEINVKGKSTSFDIQTLLKAAGNNNKELMKKLLTGSFVTDDEVKDKDMKFSVKVKKKGDEDSDEIMSVNINNNVELDNLFNIPKLRDSSQFANDKVNVVMLNAESKIIDGNLIDLRDERNVEVYTTDMNRKDVSAVIKTTLDSLYNKNTTLIEVDVPEVLTSDNPNNRTIRIPLESLEEGKKIKIITEVYEESENINHNETIANDSSPKNKKYELNIESDNGFKKYNILSPKFEYNINELIPIEISFDGVNTDFIVWYEATDDFLTKLPAKLLEKINPELLALTEQNDHCENEPIEKKDAVMDVWSGCSGAIKEMKVYPNPATSNSNVEFELEDNRVITIAIFDLSGKLIKNLKNGMTLSKGSTNEPLNLSGVNPGMYYVVVKSDKGEQALQRIIIE